MIHKTKPERLIFSHQLPLKIAEYAHQIMGDDYLNYMYLFLTKHKILIITLG